MQEIERRFLVKDLKQIDLTKYEKKTIKQSYLYSDKYTAIRKRMITENGADKYIYTVKTKKGNGIGKEEIESFIIKEEYEKLEKPTNVNEIIKDRYIVPIENNLKIELDIFKEVYEGIIFAEIEFPSEEMAKNYKKPAWFAKELTSKITNSMMAKSTRENINKIIANI